MYSMGKQKPKAKLEEVFMFYLDHYMFRIRKFISLTALVIGGLVVAWLPMYFSFAQNYETLGSELNNLILSFIMPDHPVYLYAVTAPNTYTVHFDANGWAWTMDDTGMTYDQEVTLPLNKFTFNWRSFAWWSTGAVWDVVYADGQTGVSNLTTEDWWLVTLYAQRESEIPYIIEYCQQKVTWSWCDVVETGSGFAKWDTVVILTWKTYPWFTLMTGEVHVESGWTIQYYYERNTYNLTLEDRWDTALTTSIKYWANIELPVDDPVWTGNTFDGWYLWNVKYTNESTMPAGDLVLTSKWICGIHSVKFDTDWWTAIDPITGTCGDPVVVSQNPTKEWYNFVGWNPALPSTIGYDDVEVKAIWEEIPQGKKWWWSGWWGRWGRTSRDEWDKWGEWAWNQPSWDDEHGSAKASQVTWNVSLEVLLAYMWAYRVWIVETGFDQSDPDGYIPRWDMAEMVVKFTENVLKREVPEIPSYCRWWDAPSAWKSPQTKMYAEKSCALWVMWIRMQDFMPNKILDRAEFGTILSRLLWWPTHDVVDATDKKPYYTRHLNALSREGIMTKIDNPESKRELRKWAWLMLMRARSKM